MKYFVDPLKVIRHYSRYKLNPKHSKLDSLELGVVCKHINEGANLNGAHCSLVDAKAQADIFLHPSYVPYLNKTQLLHPIDEIFSKTEVREWKKKMEPTRPVHKPWIEIDEENDITWEPDHEDAYSGNSGGPTAGPSSAILQVVCNATCLAVVLLKSIVTS